MGFSNLFPSMSLRRKFKSSETFNDSNSSTVAANEFFVATLDERFIPYDVVEVVNLSTSDCTLFINQVQEFVVPAGNKRLVFDRVIRDVRLKNISTTTIAANQLKVIYRNTGQQGRALIGQGEGVLAIVGHASSALRLFR